MGVGPGGNSESRPVGRSNRGWEGGNLRPVGLAGTVEDLVILD